LSEYSEEDLAKLRAVDDAMKGLEGVLIPYNLIVKYFAPLQKWLNLILRGDENEF